VTDPDRSAAAPGADVLLVEDDATQRAIYTKILTLEELAVEAVTNGKEALGWLESRDRPPRLVLSDIMMPELDGLELFRRILESPAWYMTPVVLMTASPTRDRLEAARTSTVPPDYFLCKPFSPKFLGKVVLAIINRESPLFLLRHFQRERLGTRRDLLGLRKKLESARENGRDEIEVARRNIEAIRRKLAELDRMRNQLSHFDGMRTNLVDDKIKSLNDELVSYEALLHENAERRIEILEEERKFLLANKDLEDLDRKIRILNQTISRDGSLLIDKKSA
jgi:CheY-like chemotaxis protein